MFQLRRAALRWSLPRRRATDRVRRRFWFTGKFYRDASRASNRKDNRVSFPNRPGQPAGNRKKEALGAEGILVGTVTVTRISSRCPLHAMPRGQMMSANRMPIVAARIPFALLVLFRGNHSFPSPLPSPRRSERGRFPFCASCASLRLSPTSIPFVMRMNFRAATPFRSQIHFQALPTFLTKLVQQSQAPTP